jgi:hypothetical protein
MREPTFISLTMVEKATEAANENKNTYVIAYALDIDVFSV